MKQFKETLNLIQLTEKKCADQIIKATELLINTYKQDRGLFLFGNGGSAADALHITGELNGRFLFDRSGLKAQSLCSDSATLTCIANDYGYEEIFSRQLQSNAKAGDVAWGISTSGNSPNVVNALKYCKLNNIKTIALTGDGGGKCREYADVLIDIPSNSTPRIQEVGILIYHCICEEVEKILFG